VKSRRDLIAECVESGLRKKVLISWTRKGNIDKIRDAARPRAHNGNAVGEECGFVDAVGYQQGRGAGFGPYPLQFDIHLAAENLVESAEGLVEKQDRRTSHQSAGDGNALAHAARQFARQRSFKPIETNKPDEIGDGLFEPGTRFAKDIKRQCDVAFDGAPGKQGGVLESNAGRPAGGRHTRFDAVDEDRARIGFFETKG
jgi:hypothetical protein